MRHDVVRQRAIPRRGATLGVHLIPRRRKLMEKVEAFNAHQQFPLQEWLADEGVQHEVVRVQQRAAITAASKVGGHVVAADVTGLVHIVSIAQQRIAPAVGKTKQEGAPQPQVGRSSSCLHVGYAASGVFFFQIDIFTLVGKR